MEEYLILKGSKNIIKDFKGTSRFGVYLEIQPERCTVQPQLLTSIILLYSFYFPFLKWYLQTNAHGIITGFTGILITNKKKVIAHTHQCKSNHLIMSENWNICGGEWQSNWTDDWCSSKRRHKFIFTIGFIVSKCKLINRILKIEKKYSSY